MIRPHSLRLISNILASLSLAMLPTGAGVLYRTDFETFTSGNDRWAGTDGWMGNSTGVAVHGIDQDVIVGGGLGKTAFIGFSQPSATLVFVAKPIHYSPQAGDLPLVRVESLVGIQDSFAKTARDSFFVSIYDSGGGYLAGIRFDNRPATYGIWRADGANPDHDTGVIFYRGELHLLSFVIDLPANRWSAELDGIPLFENAPFTATTRPVGFGFLAYEWQLGATTAAGYGDNWMLIADAVVRSVPAGIEPFRLASLVRSAAATTLTWPGQQGFDYQVEYSDNLADWRSDMPGAAFPAIATDQTLTFQDVTPGLARRFYRVLRTATP
ncbi:MAG: hypothetical protein NTW21_31215 [Verrucomicrobia bacterium]|nr:hypothetical protein [Verrucomicrobiota bacterium]